MTEFPFHHFLKSENAPAQPQHANPLSNQNYKENTEIENDNSDEVQELQTEILNQLQLLIPANGYQTYFECTFNLLKIEENSMVFSVTTPFIKNMIERKYLEKLDDAIKAILGRRYDVQISFFK